MFKRIFSLIFLILLSAGVLIAQDSAQDTVRIPEQPDCTPEGLAALYDEISSAYEVDFEADPLAARAALFKLGSLYEELALRCQYVPDDEEKSALIDRTLLVAPLPEIIAALGVGSDVDAALAEINELYGDSFNGQLLYNGIESGLDGNVLGCAGCHTSEAAPPAEGTYTRVETIYLEEPQFEDYTVREYLVESILVPHAYIVPPYDDLMPGNYPTRLDTQMLADLVAFLESQDQLLD